MGKRYSGIQDDPSRAEAVLVLLELWSDLKENFLCVFLQQHHVVTRLGFFGLHIEKEREGPFFERALTCILVERKNEDLLVVEAILPDLILRADDPLEGRGDSFLVPVDLRNQFLLRVGDQLDLPEIEIGKLRPAENGMALIVILVAPGRREIDPVDRNIERFQLLRSVPPSPLAVSPTWLGWDGIGGGALTLFFAGAVRPPPPSWATAIANPVAATATKGGIKNRSESRHGQSSSVIPARAPLALQKDATFRSSHQPQDAEPSIVRRLRPVQPVRRPV